MKCKTRGHLALESARESVYALALHDPAFAEALQEALQQSPLHALDLHPMLSASERAALAEDITHALTAVMGALHRRGPIAPVFPGSVEPQALALRWRPALRQSISYKKVAWHAGRTMDILVIKPPTGEVTLAATEQGGVWRIEPGNTWPLGILRGWDLDFPNLRRIVQGPQGRSTCSQ